GNTRDMRQYCHLRCAGTGRRLGEGRRAGATAGRYRRQAGDHESHVSTEDVRPPGSPGGAGARRRLPAAVGLAFGVAVAVGSMIGAGILRAPHDVATLLPAPFWFLAVWVIGGLYALLGANAVAELSTMDPQSGGQYVF